MKIDIRITDKWISIQRPNKLAKMYFASESSRKRVEQLVIDYIKIGKGWIMDSIVGRYEIEKD